MLSKYFREARWYEFVTFLLGVPLVLLLSVWSIWGSPFGYQGPAKETMMLALLGLVAVLLLLLIGRIGHISTTVGESLSVLNSQVRVHTGEQESIARVSLMLAEARDELRRKEVVNVYEANFQADSPTGVIQDHKQLVKDAAKNGLPLKWHMIVGQQGNEKEVWIERLEEELVAASNHNYEVHRLCNVAPSLNIIVIHQLHQTYFGMGRWSAIAGDFTGGIWIRNSRISGFMERVLQHLLNVPGTHQHKGPAGRGVDDGGNPNES